MTEESPGTRQRAKANGFAALFADHRFRCLLLLVIGFIVRMPALQGLPLWDDDYLIGENPFIKSPLLIPEAFRHYLFPDAFASHYRPVQNASFALDYVFWNTDPYGFHLTNLLLHLGSGLCLYLLLRRMFADLAAPSRAASLGAFLVALLWIVHPVHSAAVDYISGRADSLAFLFACGGWLLVYRARSCITTSSRFLLYAAAAFCALLALCSREIAAIWLCLFLAHLFIFAKQISRKAKLMSLACCLLLAGGYAGLRQLPVHEAGPPKSESTSAPTRAVLMLRSLGDYGRLMVFPSTLYMERQVLAPENYLSKSSWRKSASAEYLSVAGLVVLCVFAYGATRKGTGQPLRVFGTLWFFLGYLPISNLIDLNANVAEHWLYLPSVGFLIFLAGCVLELPANLRSVATALACVAVSGLGTRAYIRSTDWVTPKTFYQRTMTAGGSSTRVAVNLGMLYANDGEYGKAEAVFRRVLTITPDYPLARNSLADVLYRQGKRAESEATFVASSAVASERRKEYPRTWMAALNLARIRHNEQDDDQALTILAKARADYPTIWQIIRFESELLRKRGQVDPALRLVAAFARDNWWHYGASVALGQLLAEKGDNDGAVEALRFASWLDVHDAEALNLIAAAQVRQNRLGEAYATQCRAVKRQPDEPRQYHLLAGILLKMGRGAESEAAVAKVASLEAIARGPVAAN